MAAVRVRVASSTDTDSPVVPMLIPDLNDVRTRAYELHRVGAAWSGELFGWDAEYNPGSDEAPPGSNMRFTPADFCIGESGIWFFSMMWENGMELEPVEFLDDAAIVRSAA